MMENKKTYDSIDVMKFISAILIIHLHTMAFVNFNNIYLSFINKIFKLGTFAIVPVAFFMITSSWLFFFKIKNVDDSMSYFKNYIKRLVILYVVWSILYLPFTLKDICDGNILKDTFILIRKFMLTGTYGHLWYMPALIYGVAIVYYLKKHISLKKIILLSVGIYIFGLLGDSYYHILDNIPILQKIIDIYLKIFSETRMTMGMLCVALGLYFSDKYRINNKKYLYIIYVISLGTLFLETKIVTKFSLAITNERYIFKIVVSALVFLIVINANIEHRNINFHLRYCSTIMYFSHFIFIRIYQMLLPIQLLNPIILFILVTISTILLLIVFNKLSKFKRFKWIKYFY